MCLSVGRLGTRKLNRLLLSCWADKRYLPSNRSLSSRRASLLSRRSCRSISWLMRFCSLASSDRQHAISAVTVAAPCGPGHHDDGGQWAAAARPLLPAALSTRRTQHHHHHHQRGQQQQTPRATPQWPAARLASPKTHSACGWVCVSSSSSSKTTTLAVRHPPRTAATTDGTPSSMYNTSLVVPVVEPAWWCEFRVGQAVVGRVSSVGIRRQENGRTKKRNERGSRTHTHTRAHEIAIRRWATAAHTSEKRHERARTHSPREGC